MKIGMAFWTNHSEVAVGFRIALNLPKPPILDESEETTAVATPVAKSRDLCDRSLCACMSPAFKVKKLLA